jgi:hypothetical protein
MALSDFAGFFYQALDVVSRELVGFIPAASRNAELDRMAIGVPITFDESVAAAAEDISPALTPSGGAALAPNKGEVTLSKQRRVKFNFSGENALKLMNSGTYDQISGSAFAQAMRTLVNEIEADLMTACVAPSRAYGAAGTTPFNTVGSLADTANLLKIFQDNGAPLTDRRLVLTTTASANLRSKQASLFKVNEAGTDDLLRRGFIGDLQGWRIGETSASSSHTKGGGTSLVTDTGATYAKGTTKIHLDTGYGTVLAGDVVTFAGDSNKYIVATGHNFGTSGAPVEGDIVLASPGLMQTLADGVAMTVGDSYSVGGVAIGSGSLLLGSRLPALPEGGDAASDELLIQDPVSGIPFRIAVYKGDHLNQYTIETAWGCKLIAPRHSALLIG